MIKEKMLEYLMISAILNDQFTKRKYFEILHPRYVELRDEFINEYKPTITNIKNPLQDNTNKEE